MITYNITEYDKYLMLQNTIHYRVKFEVLDSDMKIINTVEGVVDGGTASIDSSSNVRRTLSIIIVPTYFYDSNMVLDPNGYIWLDKTIKFYIGIQDIRTKQYTYYPAGYFFYTDVSGQYDTETNQLNLSLNDFMIILDGTKNGQVGGAQVPEIPGYEEDPDTGKAKYYHVIRQAMIEVVSGLGYIKNYMIEEIGELYGLERYNPNYLQYRRNHPNKWNTVPHDLQFNAGTTVLEMVIALRDLYPNFETFFEPINNTFICQLIPSFEDDPIYLDNEFFRHIVLTEDKSTSLTSIRNVCEIWGETIDADYFADTSSVGNAYTSIITQYNDEIARLQNSINELTLRYIREVYDNNSSLAYDLERQIEEYRRQLADVLANQRRDLALLEQNGTASNNAYIVPIDTYTSQYQSGDILAVRIEHPNVASTAYLQVRYKDYTNNTYHYLSPVPIFRKDTERFIKPMTLERGVTYCFRIEKTSGGTLPETVAYLLGMYQIHALDVLTNGQVGSYYYERTPKRDPVTNRPLVDEYGNIEYITTIPKDVNGNPIKLYSEQYFRYKYNCEHVHLTVVPDSPFVVQKLGEILDVRTDNEAANCDSDDMAIENAKYINWQNSRLTDNITIQTLLVPFLDVNTKVSYKPQTETEEKPYIISSISHDLGSMTSSITMYRFYPLMNPDNVIGE